MLVSLIGPQHKKGFVVKDVKDRISKYKPFVETKNHLNQPIQLGKFFFPNTKSYDISKVELKTMRFNCKANVLNKQKFFDFEEKKKKVKKPSPLIPKGKSP